MTSATAVPLRGEGQALLGLLNALREEGYRFTTVSPATHARVNARPQNAEARTLADVFGWSRPFADGVLPEKILTLMHDAAVVEPISRGLSRSRVRVSSLGDDLFLHSAFPTSAPDSVFFGPDTYRFARVVRAALERRTAPIERAVDVGCGAGPGAVLVAKMAPSAEVLMVDINDAALRTAQVNATFAGAVRARPYRSDLFADIEGSFDVIVSNPPYLNDPLQRAYRHGGGRLGEALSLRILDSALGRLAPDGTLVLYTGAAIVEGTDPFHAAAAGRLASGNFAWSYEEIDPDVFGEELGEPAYAEAERIAAVVLTVTRDT
jgi:methylase of polypeptide subunit release factors